MNIKSLKKFGQNYLTDKNIVAKMIDVLNIDESSSVLEIGPGKGFITKDLLNTLNQLTAVEIDSRVVEKLKSDFSNLTIIEGDFNKVSLDNLEIIKPMKVIGNIPFNQTGNILFKLIENRNHIENAVLIIPLDIARRIVAKKRTKQYGILTVLFEYFSTPTLVMKVSPNVFFPKPNIEAAIINIEFNQLGSDTIDDLIFIKVVKAAFGNRRKTLINSLRNSIFKNCDFSKLEISLSKRAEELDVEDFLKLTKYIQNSQ